MYAVAYSIIIIIARLSWIVYARVSMCILFCFFVLSLFSFAFGFFPSKYVKSNTDAYFMPNLSLPFSRLSRILCVHLHFPEAYAFSFSSRLTKHLSNAAQRAQFNPGAMLSMPMHEVCAFNMPLIQPPS